MKNIFNNNVVITGCTGAVGSAVSELLKREGANLIGICRGTNNLSADNKKLFSTLLVHDLSCPLQDNLINKIISEYKNVNYIVHTAGSLITGKLISLSENEISSMINSNLLSVIHIVKAFLPNMRKQRKGDIIIVGSLGGIIPMPYEAVYSSMKFAVRGFCLSVAQELKEYGIKLSLISPGPIKSKMLDFEAQDDDSIISFLAKPDTPGKIAEEILKLMKDPKPEVILPKFAAGASIIFNRYPSLFYKVFSLLKKAGSNRLYQYRKKYLPDYFSNPNNYNVSI